MKSVDLVVVLPVGPRCAIDHAADTIDSVKSYTTPNRALVVVDDSGTSSGAKIRELHPEIEVLPAAGGAGLYGGLYMNLAQAFAHVLRGYQFRALLRIDTDALVIGPHPEKDAIAVFERDPLVGSAGNYQYEFGGAMRDPSYVAGKIRRHTRRPRSIVRHPDQSLALWRVLPRARRNGYYPGEEVFGGACFYNYTGLKSLLANGYLPRRSLSRTTLQEDEIFGLSLRACGYHFADLWQYNGSFACTWGTLPASPEVLAESGAKVIHSVRDYDRLSETETREFFRGIRAAI